MSLNFLLPKNPSLIGYKRCLLFFLDIEGYEIRYRLSEEILTRALRATSTINIEVVEIKNSVHSMPDFSYTNPTVEANKSPTFRRGISIHSRRLWAYVLFSSSLTCAKRTQKTAFHFSSRSQLKIPSARVKKDCVSFLNGPFLSG